jgi:plastocyanin
MIKSDHLEEITLKIFVWRRSSVILVFMMMVAIVSVSVWFYFNNESLSAFKQDKTVREIHLVTGEFKGVTADRTEIESYRWDPGTIFVEKDEKITLRIMGVSGKKHPFIIEGTDYKGIVTQGEETALNIEFNQEGVYRLICLAHPDMNNHGPMVGYIIVD